MPPVVPVPPVPPVKPAHKFHTTQGTSHIPYQMYEINMPFSTQLNNIVVNVGRVQCILSLQHDEYLLPRRILWHL